jgi:hypothetical protein
MERIAQGQRPNRPSLLNSAVVFVFEHTKTSTAGAPCRRPKKSARF